MNRNNKFIFTVVTQETKHGKTTMKNISNSILLKIKKDFGETSIVINLET
jgi:hypothetical protein